MITHNKRAQEEIVGFVVIVLLVSVVALVFLGISLRKTTPVENSVKMENFLQAALGVTTDCSIKRIPQYLEVSDLIKECYKNSKCFDGREACKVLNGTASGIMQAGFPVNSESPNKYWSFQAYYLENQTDETLPQPIYGLEEGNCTGVESGNTQSISALPGIIRVELRVCTA